MEKISVSLSSEFKLQSSKAIGSILLFGITYLVLLVFALALTVGCIWAGVLLISIKVALITIALGLGLGSLGILILIFLLKFLFSSYTVDRSDLLEITRKEEPKLFELLDRLVLQIGTELPKRVYLSSDVNASVFYDSNILSLFFPVKKNLQIGLGLINSVTSIELEAILAHEFGHFSQRSMKVGSYVYQVNQVINNLLFENESYDRLIRNWANITGYFFIFVQLAVKIIQGIQWILKKMYDLVNRSYMGLSRQMEFHADEVAAQVTGFTPLKDSLLRFSLAEHALNEVITFYTERISKNQKSGNIFQDQLSAMSILAKESQLSFRNGLPEVTLQSFNRFNPTKLIIKDQWASHPSLEERIAHLEKTGITNHKQDHSLANKLFLNLDEYQQHFSEKVFSGVSYSKPATKISSSKFQMEFEKELAKNSFPKLYNGYYDQKNPTYYPLKPEQTPSDLSLKALFSDEKVDLIYLQIALANDLSILQQIAQKAIKIKTFDYDGIKYNYKQAKELTNRLKGDLENLALKIQQNDEVISHFFLNAAAKSNQTSTLEKLYQELDAYDQLYEKQYSVYAEFSERLGFVNEVLSFDKIRKNFLDLKPLEAQLKNGIRAVMESKIYKAEITEDMLSNFNLYLSRDWEYFGHESYFEERLSMLVMAKNDYAYLLSQGYFLLKKELLAFQENLVSN